MLNRLNNVCKHYGKQLRPGWFFRKYNYTTGERENFYQIPSQWIVHLFTNRELSANRRKAARLLARKMIGSKREWAEFIVGTLIAVADEKVSLDEATRQITVKAKEREASICDYRFWLELQSALIALGFFRAGGIMRECALASLLGQSKHHNPQNQNPLLAKFQAALELGDFTTAAANAEAASKSLSEAEAPFLSALVALFSRQTTISQSGLQHIMQPWEEPYRRLQELVQDKSVAVVGPSVTDSELSSEIEGYDVVIRCGFWGRDSLPPGTGEKTSASFYAGHKVRELIDSDQSNVLNMLELILLKHRPDRTRLRSIGIAEKAIGFSLPARQAFFETHPMAIPQVIHNLAFAKPREVKVFKVNFFLEPGYPPGYEIGKELRKKQAIHDNLKIQDPTAKCNSFAYGHDPLAQIRFMRHAWKCDLIKGDKEFNDIMMFSDEEYLQKLESIFGYNGSLRYHD